MPPPAVPADDLKMLEARKDALIGKLHHRAKPRVDDPHRAFGPRSDVC